MCWVFNVWCSHCFLIAFQWEARSVIDWSSVCVSIQTVTREMNKLLFPGCMNQALLLAVFIQLYPFPAYVNINLCSVVFYCSHFSFKWKYASEVLAINNFIKLCKELKLVMVVHSLFLNKNIYLPCQESSHWILHLTISPHIAPTLTLCVFHDTILDVTFCKWIIV